MIDRIDNAPQGLSLWIAGIRPRTLTIAASPVIVGIGLAFYSRGIIDWLVMAVTLFSAFAVQAGTNLYNDAADGMSGQDSPARLGPARLTAQGWATSQEVKRAAQLCFAMAMLAGAYLAQIGGWPIIGIGIVSITCGYAYSSGPLPISHTPLGEVFVIAFFGITAVAGTYYLQTGTVDANAVIAGVIIGSFSAAVLMINNMRDQTEDQLGGRRTLAILAGARLSRLVYGFLILMPFAVQFANEQGGVGAGNWLPLLTLPFGAFLVWRCWQAESGSVYNALLEQTAKLQVVFSLLFFLGLLALKLEQST